MYASGGWGSSHNVEPSTYRNVNWALFFLPHYNQLCLSKPGAVQKVSCPIHWDTPFVIARLTKYAKATSVGRAYERKMELSPLYGGEV